VRLPASLKYKSARSSSQNLNKTTNSKAAQKNNNNNTNKHVSEYNKKTFDDVRAVMSRQPKKLEFVHCFLSAFFFLSFDVNFLIFCSLEFHSPCLSVFLKEDFSVRGLCWSATHTCGNQKITAG
jgi:hypothetical protein